VGVTLVVVFVARVGPGRLASELAQAGPHALWLLVTYGVGTALGAFPFGRLLPPSLRPSAWALIQGRFAASTANALLPFFGVAGEPSRLLWLPPEGHARGIAAIVVDRILYNASNGMLLMAGALVAAGFTSLPAELAAIACALGALTVGVTAAGFVLVARAGVGRRLHALLLRMLGERYAREDFGRAVDSALIETVRGPQRPLAYGLVVHLVARAVLVLEVPVGLLVLDAGASVAQAVVLAVVPIAVSFAFSSIPSQLGVQEGAQTLVAGAIGLDPTVVLAVVLLQRFRQLAFALLLPVLLAGARAPVGPQRESVNDP
jgi:hypothetical protein